MHLRSGAVKDEYKELFKNATGSVSLKVSLKLEHGEFARICEKIAVARWQRCIQNRVPNIQNIVPVNVPADIDGRPTAINCYPSRRVPLF